MRNYEKKSKTIIHIEVLVLMANRAHWAHWARWSQQWHYGHGFCRGSNIKLRKNTLERLLSRLLARLLQLMVVNKQRWHSFDRQILDKVSSFRHKHAQSFRIRFLLCFEQVKNLWFEIRAMSVSLHLSPPHRWKNGFPWNWNLLRIEILLPQNLGEKNSGFWLV